MSESKPVDIDRENAVKLAPGEPVEAQQLSQMGSTFAERAAAAAKAQGSEKAVKSDDSDVEDKAVKKAATKKKS